MRYMSALMVLSVYNTLPFFGVASYSAQAIKQRSKECFAAGHHCLKIISAADLCRQFSHLKLLYHALCFV